jgi:G3E family GTPase
VFLDIRFQSISTVLIPISKPINLPQTDKWLQSILWERTLPIPPTSTHPEHNPLQSKVEVLRLKALFETTEGEFVVVQGVQEIYDKQKVSKEMFLRGSGKTEAKGDPECKLVLIGIYLIWYF